MAYDLAGALAEGYTPTEIAEHLAKVKKYDIIGARKEGYSDDEIATHLAGKMPKRNKGIVSDLGTDIKRGVEQIPGMVTGLADISNPMTYIDNRASAGALANRAGEITGFQPSKWAEEAQQEYSPQRQQSEQEISQVWNDPTTGALDVAKSYLTHPGVVAGRVAEALPSTLLGGGAGRAASLASKAVTPAIGAGLGEAGITAGSIMNQATQGGLAPEDARRKAAAALGAGLVTGVIGGASAGLANRLGIVDPESIFNKPAVQALTETEINTFMNAANRGIGSRIGIGAVKEGLLEELPQSAQEQMWQNYAENKPIMEGVTRSAVEGALAGSAMGGGFNAISKGMSADDVKAEVARRTQIKAEEIKKLQDQMATEAMGGTRESRPQEAALAAQTQEDKMGRENVRTELARPIYQTKEEVTTVLEKLRDVYPELDQKQLNQTRVELQRIRDTLPTQAEAAKALAETKPTVAPPVAPTAQPTPAPAPVVNPLVIDDNLLQQWGITGRNTRSALKEYGDLSNPEHVAQVQRILTELSTVKPGAKAPSNAKLISYKNALDYITNLPNLGAPNVQAPETPASPSVPDSGTYNPPVGQGTLPGMGEPVQPNQPAPEEVKEPQGGGVDVPGGVPVSDPGSVGASPTSEPSPLTPEGEIIDVGGVPYRKVANGYERVTEPTAPVAVAEPVAETPAPVAQPTPEAPVEPEIEGTPIEEPEPAPEKINYLKELARYRTALEKIDPEIASEIDDLETDYKEAVKVGKKGSLHRTTAEQGIQGWMDWAKRTYPQMELPPVTETEQPASEAPSTKHYNERKPHKWEADSNRTELVLELGDWKYEFTDQNDVMIAPRNQAEYGPALVSGVNEFMVRNNGDKRGLYEGSTGRNAWPSFIPKELIPHLNAWTKARSKSEKEQADIGDALMTAFQKAGENNILESKGKQYVKNPTSVERLEAAFKKLFTPNLLRVKPPNIVNKYDDIADPYLRQAAKGRASAFVYPPTQQEYYIAEAIPKGNEIGLILHEKGTHLGLNKLIGTPRINALSRRVETWAKEKGDKVENKIARRAVQRANASKETKGGDRWREEIIAYFATVAVNDYDIDPLKDQPKEFVKVAGWLRELWNGVLSTIRKMQYNPEALTAQDIVSMIYGAARIEMHEDYEGKPNVPAGETTTAPKEPAEEPISEARPESFNPTGKAIKDVDLKSMDLRPETTQEIRTIPAGTRLFHGAHGARADELNASGNVLNARAPYKSGGGTLDEGGLLWFGDNDLAQGHANSAVDSMKAKWEEEDTGVKRRPGQVFSTVTEEPLKLISKYYEVTQDEADRLNEALGLPDYKRIKAGDEVDRAAYRALEYRPSNIPRYKVGNDTMGAPWPIIFETLGVDGFVDQSGIAIGVDTVATSPLQNMQEVRKTKDEPAILATGIDSVRRKKAKKPTSQESAEAKAAGRQFYEDQPEPTFKERVQATVGSDWAGWLVTKLVGGGEALALKGIKMFGPEARLNPDTGKELGYLNYHRALHDNDLATGAAQYGYLEMDKEGVIHVKDSKDNVVALNGLANKIKDKMMADGMTEAAADDAFAHMALTGRFKELQKMGILSDKEFNKADHAYGQEMKDKYAAEYQEWNDMYQRIRARTMDIMVKSGTFSPKKAKEFLDRLEYIPFNREQDVGTSDAVFLRSLLSAKAEHHIKGSNRSVKNVMDNIVDNQVWLMKRAVRNNASNLIAETMEYMQKQNPLMGGYETTQEDKSPNVISYLKDGNITYFKVLDKNDAVIFAAAPAINNTAIRLMRMFTGYLRKGVTLMPSFHYGQIIQDAMRAPAVAGTKAGMAQLLRRSVPEFVSNIKGETELAKSLRRAGVVGQIDYQDTYDNWRKEVMGGKRTKLGTVLEGAERIAQSNDLATRAAVYDDVYKQTKNENEASLRALMMINFQNRGHSQAVNTLMAAVPFVNSRIQGEYRLLMALTGRIPGVSKAQAKQLIMWRAAKMAAFTALYAMVSGGDDDYERAGEEVKNRNFLLNGVKIPVAPEFLALKVGVEKAYRLATDQEFETGAKAARAELSALGGLLIGMGDMTPTMIKPMLENATNYSFFSGHNLVGFNQMSKDVNLRFNEGTSEFSKGLSNIMQDVGGNTMNISPIKMDNLIRGWFGTMGKDFLYTVDMMVGDKPAAKWNQLPLAGGMFYDMEGGALKSDFYDLKDESDRAYNTLNDMKKNNPEDAQAYYDEHKPLLAIHSRLDKMGEYLNNSRKEKQYFTKLDPSTARDKISEIDTRVHEMLKQNLPLVQKYLDEQDGM